MLGSSDQNLRTKKNGGKQQHKIDPDVKDYSLEILSPRGLPEPEDDDNIWKTDQFDKGSCTQKANCPHELVRAAE